MAYKITDKCVSAISEGDPIYTIDESACLSCGTCASVCPQEAIVED